MILILLFFLFISYFLIIFYKEIDNKNNISPAIIITSFIGAISFVGTILLFLDKNITYKLYSIISLSWTFTLMLLYISFFIFWFIRYKNKHENISYKIVLLSTFKKNWLILASILIFAFLLLFVNNHFSDTGYYLDLSSHFKEFNQLPSYNDTYRYTSSYYIYASYSLIWDNTIPIFFNFFTPFTFFLVLISYINDWLDHIHKNSEKLWVIKILFFIPLVILMLFFNPFVISGNLFIQFSIILFVVICLITKKEREIPYCLLFCEFFSITGLMMSIIITIGIIFFYLFFKGVRYFINNSTSLFIASIPLPIFLFVILGNKVTYNLCLVLFLLLLLILLSIAITIFLFKYKLKKNSIENKFINWQGLSKLTSKKWFFITAIIIALICTLVIILYFAIGYKIQFDQWYEWGMLVLSGSIGLPLLFILIKNKKQENDYWYLLVINLILVAITVFFAWVIGFNNSSMWRIVSTTIFFNFDSCNFFLIALMLYMVIMSFFKSRIKFDTNRLVIWFNKNKKIIIAPFLLVYTLIFSLILIITNVVNIPNKEQFSLFNKNVVQNIKLLTNNDIKQIKALNIKSKTFVIDNVGSMYLPSSNNLDVSLMEAIYGKNIADIRYWMYTRMNFFDWQFNYFGNNWLSIDNFVNKFSANITADYLILDKSTPYFEKLINDDKIKATYINSISSDSLLILSK